MNFNTITEFENKLAQFFGSPYAVAIDCCTHGVELSLRYTKAQVIEVPKHTYLSIPFLAYKLNIELKWKDDNWRDYYYLTDTVIDAAVLWKKDSYIPGTYMNISFQYQKHLSLGRGGVILTDNKIAAEELKKMSYDGRLPNIPWAEQNIDLMGYHYYMTPETASDGIEKFKIASATNWFVSNRPNI